MKDHPIVVIGLVTLLATSLWIILFWTVPIAESWKNILLAHFFVAVFFLTVSGAISYFLKVPLEFDHLVVRVIGLAPAVGGYLQLGRRKS